VFAQGSYSARTNVRQNSDVDVCVCYAGSAFFDEYQGGSTRSSVGNLPATYSYSDYKNAIGKALVDHFGGAGVTRGKKAFTVHENTYRIDADVIPTWEYRCYRGTVTAGVPVYISGIGFIPDGATQVIANWPEQTYANGVARNNATSRFYKRTIRILKRLRDKMQTNGIVASNDVASFLIECLVWNVPAEYFDRDTHTQRVRATLMHAFNNTLKDDLCSEWLEVSELKYLFRPSQPWTRQKAHAFVSAAWDYIGLE
jgi:hypothetical protein